MATANPLSPHPLSPLTNSPCRGSKMDRGSRKIIGRPPRNRGRPRTRISQLERTTPRLIQPTPSASLDSFTDVSTAILSSISPVTQSSPSQHPPMTRRRRRDWEQRIDPLQEVIRPFQILSNEDRPQFVEFPRVLLSHHLSFSYIYQSVLDALGFDATTVKSKTISTRFGLLQATGFVCIYVCAVNYDHNPYLIDFLVLPGSPPTGGVPFMLGTKDIPSDLHNPSSFDMPMPPRSDISEAVAFMLSSGSKPLSQFMDTSEVRDVCTALENHEDSTTSTPLSQDEINLDDDIPPIETKPSTLAAATEQSKHLPPVSWKSGFSWKSQHLLLDGEEIPTGQSHAAGLVDRESVTRDSSASDLTAKANVEVRGSEDLSLEGLDEGCFVIGSAERRDFLVDLLVQHYWRSHPPLRPGRQNGSHGRHSGISTTSRPSGSRPSGKQRPQKKGKGIDHGSGGGDDDEDDEERDGDGDNTPSGTAGSEPKRDYFACPFLKWRPVPYFSTCGSRFRTISHLNKHLLLEHYNRQCTRCHQTFESAEENHQHLQQPCVGTENLLTRPGVISEEHWAQIFERPKRKSKFESSDQVERWYSTFAILFPDHPKPHSPYMHMQGKGHEISAHFSAYAQREALPFLRRVQQKLLRQDDGPSIHGALEEETSVVLDEVVLELIKQVTDGYMTEMTMDSAPVPHEVGGPSTSSHHTPSAPSTPRASDNHSAITTRYAHPAESPYPSDGSFGLTSPTSIGLTTGSSITEVLSETEVESVGEDPMSMDLNWHDTMESELLTLDLDSMELTGFGAWDEATIKSSDTSKPHGSTNWGLTPMDLNVSNDQNHFQDPHDIPSQVPFYEPPLDSYMYLDEEPGLPALAEQTGSLFIDGMDLTEYTTLSTELDETAGSPAGLSLQTSNLLTHTDSISMNRSYDPDPDPPLPTWMGDSDHSSFYGTDGWSWNERGPPT